MNPKRDISILLALSQFYCLTRAQISDLCMPEDICQGNRNGRMTRKRLLYLYRAGLINRTQCEVVNPRGGSAAHVFFPSRKGLEYLSAEFGDERYLNGCTLTPNWQHLLHWTQISQFHIELDRAVKLRDDVTLDGWLGEWDVANPDEKDPDKRYTLFTLIREQPRLVCAPDFAFMLGFKGYRRVFYGELDRGTSGIRQIASSKTPGYANMGTLHRRHFPDTNLDDFRVLTIVPKRGRQELLRKAIKSKPGANLWRFAAWEDITPKSLLTESIWYSCEEEGPIPLIKTGSQPVPSSVSADHQGVSA